VKLTELEPRWLIDEPGRRWFVFRSPGGHGDWLTCKSFVWAINEQREKARELIPDMTRRLVLCDPPCAWSITGDFSNMTVTPSIDASKSGNWHGFIRNGEIT